MLTMFNKYMPELILNCVYCFLDYYTKTFKSFDPAGCGPRNGRTRTGWENS